jgi:hypothetical protein
MANHSAPPLLLQSNQEANHEYNTGSTYHQEKGDAHDSLLLLKQPGDRPGDLL